MIKNCKLCGREFKGQRTNSEYCSQSCYRDARREYERLKIQRRKERERRKNTEDNMTQIRNLAVVASEIGKLASQSAKSSDEIDEITVQLVEKYKVIMGRVESMDNNMTTQNEKLSDTQTVFDVLEKDITDAVGKIESINSMVESLNEEIGSLVDMLATLSAISQENSAATQQVMASIEESSASIELVNEKAHNVDSSAESLKGEVGVFQTE